MHLRHRYCNLMPHGSERDVIIMTSMQPLYSYYSTSCLSGHPVVYRVGLLCNRAGQGNGCLSGHPVVYLVGLLCNRAGQSNGCLSGHPVMYPVIRLCNRAGQSNGCLSGHPVMHPVIRLCNRAGRATVRNRNINTVLVLIMHHHVNYCI